MFLLGNDYWEIKKTQEKGSGVFAKKEIQKGIIIGDYSGIVLRPQDAVVDEENFYLMYYSDQAVISPDLKRPGPHLLNHSCVPNCWIYTYRGHTLFFALRKIEIGEELTISYLLSPKDESCNPCLHICRCKSTFCIGTMHLSQRKFEMWQKFQNEENKKTKKMRIVYGKDLPLLSSYPKINSNNPIYKTMCSFGQISK
jgi:SET domain-containing protein